MFAKIFFVAALAIACVSGKPLIAVSAPLVAAPGVVTAQSSQYIARNYNGIAPLAYTAAAYAASPYAASPYAAAYASPYAAAYASPYAAAYASPYLASPYAAYSAPVAVL